MRKLLNNPWFVGVASLIATAFVVKSVWPSKPHYAQTAVEVAAPSPVEVTKTDGGEVGALSIPDALKSLPILPTVRDPFAVLVVAEKTSGSTEKIVPADSVDTVHLSAVWIQHGTALAIINGRIAESGEEFGRIKVESATSEGVWFSHWKGHNFVSVGGDFSLSTPANQKLAMTSPL